MTPPGDEVAVPAGVEGLTAAQREDLATVVATLGHDLIVWLVRSILGEQPIVDAADHVADTAVFASKMVNALHAAGRLAEAIAILRRDAVPRGRLAVHLEYILRGGRLSDAAARQAFINEVEPFLNSAEFLERHPRFLRTVCAIALGNPWNTIRGSGFLIGPDLVMTNAHVLDPYLDRKDGELQQGAGVTGDQIFCFFDYHADPAPKVPHQEGKHAYETVTARKDDWLVHGRDVLPGEGTAACPKDAQNRYDYAVIALSRKIGNQPARRGGGPPRGWLTLPEVVDVFMPERRIILYQHPGGFPQQFDIGEYVDRDCTNTRVRYTVSSANGASGGAAVNSQGELFALHSAAVKPEPGQRRVNQGVQIDLIARDLLALKPELKGLSSPEERPFWSLTDDLSDPKPIIGRSDFRENVLDLHRNYNPTAPRVLAVSGPPGSGRKFSVDLLRRTIGVDVRIVTFGADALSKSTPQQFLATLASSLGFYAFQEQEIPKEDKKADLPRWLDGDLPRWLAARLEDEVKRDPSRYPAWVILNTAVDDFKWAFLLPELLAALAGAHDPGKAGVPMPHLRFLFLASKPDSIPSMPGVQRVIEDLSVHDKYAGDFADCLDRAFYAIDKKSDLGDLKNWELVAMDFAGALDVVSRRQALAGRVRNLFLLRSKAGGP